MSNIVNNYLKVLKVISSLNIDFCSSNHDARKYKMTDVEIVALMFND